jgi:negative regulator of sigma E activity
MSQIDPENMKETISALLDNEADDLELRRFLKSCEQDPELLKTWERYSLAQSALHDAALPVKASLSQRIAAEIELEAPLAAKAVAPAATSWKDGLTKMAIAASVAAVFLVAVQVSLDSGSGPSAIPTIAEQATLSDDLADSDSARILVADSNGDAPVVENGGMLTEYIESLTLDNDEPIRIEHMQDSPLYRLVNAMQEKP